MPTEAWTSRWRPAPSVELAQVEGALADADLVVVPEVGHLVHLPAAVTDAALPGDVHDRRDDQCRRPRANAGNTRRRLPPTKAPSTNPPPRMHEPDGEAVLQLDAAEPGGAAPEQERAEDQRSEEPPATARGLEVGGRGDGHRRGRGVVGGGGPSPSPERAEANTEVAPSAAVVAAGGLRRRSWALRRWAPRWCRKCGGSGTTEVGVDGVGQAQGVEEGPAGGGTAGSGRPSSRSLRSSSQAPRPIRPSGTSQWRDGDHHQPPDSTMIADDDQHDPDHLGALVLGQRLDLLHEHRAVDGRDEDPGEQVERGSPGPDEARTTAAMRTISGSTLRYSARPAQTPAMWPVVGAAGRACGCVRVGVAVRLPWLQHPLGGPRRQSGMPLTGPAGSGSVADRPPSPRPAGPWDHRPSDGRAARPPSAASGSARRRSGRPTTASCAGVCGGPRPPPRRRPDGRAPGRRGAHPRQRRRRRWPTPCAWALLPARPTAPRARARREPRPTADRARRRRADHARRRCSLMGQHRPASLPAGLVWSVARVGRRVRARVGPHRATRAASGGWASPAAARARRSTRCPRAGRGPAGASRAGCSSWSAWPSCSRPAACCPSSGQLGLAVLATGVGVALLLGPVDRAPAGATSTASAAQRIRSEERSEMAAHLHDSVLQTLTLIQRHADDAPAGRACWPGARSASCGRGSSTSGPRSTADPTTWSPRSRPWSPRSRTATWWRSTSWWWATARSTDALEGARGRAARGRPQRGPPRRGGGGVGLRRGRAGAGHGLRARPRQGLRPRRGGARPARRARVDHRPHGAPRRPGRGAQHARARAPRSCSRCRGPGARRR